MTLRPAMMTETLIGRRCLHGDLAGTITDEARWGILVVEWDGTGETDIFDSPDDLDWIGRTLHPEGWKQ